MKQHTAGRVATALLCATTVLITGCGSGSDSAEGGAGSAAPTAEGPAEPKHPFDTMTPEQIDRQAREAVKDATSMRWTGSFSSAGRHMEVDLAVDVHGSCNGTVSSRSTGTWHIIRKGSLVHFKAEEEYWRAAFGREMTAGRTEEMVAHFTGRWIKPPKGMSEIVGNMCDGVTSRIEALSRASGGSTTREADATVNGRPVAVLSDTTTTVYVAKKGKPYALRITTTGDEPTDVTLTDYDKPVDTTPPPPDQVLDPTTLR
ncbi:hypothetical protein [Streptomyces caelestis]|uniref:hypothetical protein n=1 Tax=Streptomyces caelestis TaxID=36816 RepID=UPI003664DCCD